MKIISIVNQKGGVAKTTSSINIGAAFARAGKQVLLVDIDPQGNLSESLGFDNPEKTTYDVLQGEDINAAIRSKSGYYVLPTDENLAGAEITLVDVYQRDYKLKNALKRLEKPFDYVLIDCPPSLGILTLMALTASDEVLIPVQTQYLPLKGVVQIMDTIKTVHDNLNEDISLCGLFCTLYRGYNLDKDAESMIREAFPEKVFKTVIRLNNKLAEAPSHFMDIFEYAPKSNGAKQYKALAAEILKHETTEKG